MNDIENFTIITWRIPHTPLKLFEKLSTKIKESQEILKKEKPVFYMFTCQRVLIAFISDNNKFQRISNIITKIDPELEKTKEVFKGKNAFEHLVYVASSIDSLVLGEPQILGQTKKANEELTKEKILTGELKIIIQNAIKAAVKIFNNTDLPKGKVSLISLVEEEIKRFIQQNQKTKHEIIVSIVGTGKMGQNSEKIIKRHAKNAVFYFITRRKQILNSKEKIIGFQEFLENPPYSDIIVLANDKTEPYFGEETVQKILSKKETTQILVLDLGVPRNSKEELRNEPKIKLIQISDLFETINKNKEQRQNAIYQAKPIIEEQYYILEKKIVLEKEKNKIIKLRKDLETVAENRKKQLLKQIIQQKDPEKIERSIELLVKDVIHVSQKHFEEILLEGARC